jgi:hypothetical protein
MYKHNNKDTKDTDWSVVPVDDGRVGDLPDLLIKEEHQKAIMQEAIQQRWAYPCFPLYSYMYNNGKINGNMRASSAFLYRAIERGIFKNNTAWTIQEKYDGWYAVWDGARLLKKSGQPLQIKETIKGGKRYPIVDVWEKWLSEVAPGIPLAGEVHAGRGHFRFIGDHLSQPIREASEPVQVYFTVFDIPFMTKYTCSVRMNRIRSLFASPRGGCSSIRLAPYQEVTTQEEAARVYRSIVYNMNAPGQNEWETIANTDKYVMAEGVILRMCAACYRPGVSRAIIKLKAIALVCVRPSAGVPLPPDPYQNAEKEVGDSRDDEKNDDDYFPSDTTMRIDLGDEKFADDLLTSRQYHSVCSTRVMATDEGDAIRNWTKATHRRMRSRILSCGSSYANGLTGDRSGVSGSILPRSTTVSFRPLLTGYPVVGTLRFFPSSDRYIREHRDRMGLFDPHRTNAVNSIYAWCHLYEVCMGWNLSSGEAMLESATKPNGRTRLAETVLYIAGSTDVDPRSNTLRTEPRKAIAVQTLTNGFKPIYPIASEWWPSGMMAPGVWVAGETMFPYTFVRDRENVPVLAPLVRDRLRSGGTKRSAGGRADLHPYVPQTHISIGLILLLMIFDKGFDTEMLEAAREKEQQPEGRRANVYPPLDSPAALELRTTQLFNPDLRRSVYTGLRRMIDIVSVAIAVYQTSSNAIYTRNMYNGSVNTRVQAGLLALRNQNDRRGLEYIGRWNALVGKDGHIAVAFKTVHRQIKKSELKTRLVTKVKGLWQDRRNPLDPNYFSETLGAMRDYLMTDTYEGEIMNEIGLAWRMELAAPDSYTARAASLLRIFTPPPQPDDSNVADTDGCVVIDADTESEERRWMYRSELIDGVLLLRIPTDIQTSEAVPHPMPAARRERLRGDGWLFSEIPRIPRRPAHAVVYTASDAAVLQKWEHDMKDVGTPRRGVHYVDTPAQPPEWAPKGTTNPGPGVMTVERKWGVSDIPDIPAGCVCFTITDGLVRNVMHWSVAKAKINALMVDAGTHTLCLSYTGHELTEVAIRVDSQKRVTIDELKRLFFDLRRVNSKQPTVGEDRGVIFI